MKAMLNKIVLSFQGRLAPGRAVVRWTQCLFRVLGITLNAMALAFVFLTLAAIQVRGADLKAPHVVFVIGENEYHTWETLPDFAERELVPQGLKCSFVNASPK